MLKTLFIGALLLVALVLFHVITPHAAAFMAAAFLVGSLGLAAFPRSTNARLVVRRKFLVGASLALIFGAVLLTVAAFQPQAFACLLTWHSIAPTGCMLATAPVTLTMEQIQELRSAFSDLKANAEKIREFVEEFPGLRSQIKSLSKSRLAGLGNGGAPRKKGRLSDEAARGLASAWVLHCEKSGKIGEMVPRSDVRNALLAEARSFMSLERALSTTEIPLPTVYAGELMELIADFGVLRNEMTSYPMSAGINKPPRMGTRPAFGSIAMSAPFPELKPTLGFASLEPHKVGGIVITPREIQEETLVPMGQYLARYGAVEFARVEDTWGFLADGSNTYESVKGVCQICRDNNKTIVLAAGKTKPSDAALNDFRNLRGVANTAALKNGAYYVHNSWESAMRAFNTIGSNYIFNYLPDGTATLDGFRIVWTNVMTPYGTSAAANSPVAVFGDLEFYWFGQHLVPRIDSSEHVLFSNDQIVTRFIEEIDFDYNAIDAAATLITAAA